MASHCTSGIPSKQAHLKVSYAIKKHYLSFIYLTQFNKRITFEVPSPDGTGNEIFSETNINKLLSVSRLSEESVSCKTCTAGIRDNRTKRMGL
jgi:hypothetical protein